MRKPRALPHRSGDQQLVRAGPSRKCALRGSTKMPIRLLPYVRRRVTDIVREACSLNHSTNVTGVHVPGNCLPSICPRGYPTSDLHNQLPDCVSVAYEHDHSHSADAPEFFCRDDGRLKKRLSGRNLYGMAYVHFPERGFPVAHQTGLVKATSPSSSSRLAPADPHFCPLLCMLRVYLGMTLITLD